MQLILRAILWFGLYLTMVLIPLFVGAVFIAPANSPSFLVNLAAALGYIGFALMAAELALVSRFAGASRAFGLDSLQQFHRQMGIAALALVVAHPVLLIASGVYPAHTLLPSSRMPWPVWLGTLALLAALLVVGLSVFRRHLRLPYEVWQISHGVLAIVLIGFAGVHIHRVGRFSALPSMQVVWTIYLVVLIGLLLRYRLIRPLAMLRKPWEVVENRGELGAARTLTLRPIGHPGFTFEPGQFAWIGFGSSPFSRSQHPISFSSNGDIPAGDGLVSFTIKDEGDWSGRLVPAVKPGARAWVDGPHGVFTIDREEGPGYVLIGGGIGIAPL